MLFHTSHVERDCSTPRGECMTGKDIPGVCLDLHLLRDAARVLGDQFDESAVGAAGSGIRPNPAHLVECDVLELACLERFGAREDDLA